MAKGSPGAYTGHFDVIVGDGINGPKSHGMRQSADCTDLPGEPYWVPRRL